MSVVCVNCGLPIEKIIDPWGYDNYRGQVYGWYHPTVEREANMDGADVMVHATSCPNDLGEADPGGPIPTCQREGCTAETDLGGVYCVDHDPKLKEHSHGR